MVNVRLIWQAPLFITFVGLLMSFEDPFRVALAGAMLALMAPVRRLVLTLDPDAALKVRNSR